MMIAGRLNRQPMDRPMKPFGLTTADMIAWIVRIGLGTLFVVAGIGKIADPTGFAAIVANYRILPSSLVAPTAVVLPWVETLSGLALLGGRLGRGGALLINLLMLVFLAVTLYNAYRGLNVACGCFSLSAEAPSNLALTVVRNLFIFAAGTWLLFRPAAPQPSAVRSSARH